jgi:hypothetical protein
MVFDGSQNYWCVPKSLQDTTKYEAKLDKYEEKLVAATMKPFLPSGHAFVCFDSVESAVACIEHFKAGAKEYCNYLLHTCKEQCCCGQ